MKLPVDAAPGRYEDPEASTGGVGRIETSSDEPRRQPRGLTRAPLRRRSSKARALWPRVRGHRQEGHRQEPIRSRIKPYRRGAAALLATAVIAAPAADAAWPAQAQPASERLYAARTGTSGANLPNTVDQAAIAGLGSAATPVTPGTSTAPALPDQAVPSVARTWKSGASGRGVANGSFGGWRGEPVAIAGTWNDSDWTVQAHQYSLSGEYRNWNRDIDVAIGAFYNGGSWQAAANGSYDTQWTQAVRTVRQKRAGKGGTTYVRLAHEFNGTWYPWKVTSANVAAFKSAWRRFATMFRREFPEGKIVWSANGDTTTNVGIPEMWPGGAYVDVIGVDSYDFWPSISSRAVWDSQYMATRNNSPRGPGAWAQFARNNGKPLAFPEWGLHIGNDNNPGPEDNPLYIQLMHDFFIREGILYELYNNVAGHGGTQIYGGGSNPNAAAAYRQLTWGVR